MVKVGDKVAWKWLGAVVEGVVIDVSSKRTEIISKGKLITRNGTTDNPAIVIDHQDGNQVIKLQSELIL
jgi:hypothetical protein